MKKSILTLIAFIAIIISAGSVQAQNKPESPKAAVADVASVSPSAPLFKAELTSEEKESTLQILNVAKMTLLKSSNTNTTEENLMLIRSLEQTLQLLNVKFQKVVTEEIVKPKN
jgi:hypothetical protein